MWDELDKGRRDLYRWFHGRECHIWDNSQCPIVRYQNVDTGRGAPLFYPEAIYGEPRFRKDVFFLTINPNCSGGALGELAVCPNVETNENMDLRSYASQYLSWFAVPDVRKHSDKPTQAALWLMMRVVHAELPAGRPFVEFDSAQFRQAEAHGLLVGLVELNMAHCKCRAWTKRFGLDDPWPGHPFEERCEAKTLEAIELCKPRAVVMMGGPQTRWLDRCVAARGVAPWKIDAEEMRFRDVPQYGHSVTLHWNDDQALETELVSAYHPSHEVNYTRAHAEQVATLLSEILQ